MTNVTASETNGITLLSDGYEVGPNKLMFQADRLEDVVFRIGGKEYTIDFSALVRDYGKAVEHE